MLEQARELKREVGSSVRLIMNDRADLCLAADFDGVHVGQDDLSPESVREIIGPERILGVSTHNPEQLCLADSVFSAHGPILAAPPAAHIPWVNFAPALLGVTLHARPAMTTTDDAPG